MTKGLSIEDAMIQMTFCKKKAAQKVLNTLVRLKRKALRQGYPINRMVISKATVGRGRITREIDIKGRGRYGIIKHYQSQVTITLQEPNYESLYKKRFKVPSFGENKNILVRLDY